VERVNEKGSQNCVVIHLQSSDQPHHIIQVLKKGWSRTFFPEFLVNHAVSSRHIGLFMFFMFSPYLGFSSIPLIHNIQAVSPFHWMFTLKQSLSSPVIDHIQAISLQSTGWSHLSNLPPVHWLITFKQSPSSPLADHSQPVSLRVIFQPHATTSSST